MVRYSQLLVRLRTQLLEVVMGDRQWLHLVRYKLVKYFSCTTNILRR